MAQTFSLATCLLARLVALIVQFTGDVARDPSKPDGTPHKLMRADRLRALGWQPKISLDADLAETYRSARETGAV